MDPCDNKLAKLNVTASDMAGFSNMENLYDLCDLANDTKVKSMSCHERSIFYVSLVQTKHIYIKWQLTHSHMLAILPITRKYNFDS